MSRHERNTPGAPGRRPTANEAEATTTATIIAGLRPRLWRQDILRHPLVRDELQKLLEEVAVLLGQVDPRPGRHRSSAVNMPGQVSDAQGHDLKPDPLAATTPAEFITALWQYRAWSGNPSWRKMATKAGQVVVHSTMFNAMNGEALPKFEVVKAVIIGCGGSEEDLHGFANAWRRIGSGRARSSGKRQAHDLPPSDSELVSADRA